MCSALGGMLTVYKRVILLAVLVGMRKGYLDILALQVNNGVECIAGHTVLQQILKSVT